MVSRHRSDSLPAVRQVRQVQLAGRRIRKLRKEHRLSHAELAERVGLQAADLMRMEKGEYRISLDVLFRILGVFEVRLDDFLEDESKSVVVRDLRTVRDL